MRDRAHVPATRHVRVEVQVQRVRFREPPSSLRIIATPLWRPRSIVTWKRNKNTDCEAARFYRTAKLAVPEETIHCGQIRAHEEPTPRACCPAVTWDHTRGATRPPATNARPVYSPNLTRQFAEPA